MVSLVKTKNKKKYFPEIDLLKAFAAFLVVFIHVISWYKSKGVGFQYTWDLAHFSVGAFVFASGFLMANSKIKDRSVKGVLLYLWKRFKRIVLPYFIYVVAFLATKFILDGIGNTVDRFTWEYWWRTLSLNGGIGGNWIPRLFMGLSLLYIFAELVNPYIKHIYYYLFGIASVLSVYFMFGSSDFMRSDQKLAGWFVIFMAGFYLSKNYDKFKVLFDKLLNISIVTLVTTYIFMAGTFEHLSIFSNKWPPNLYFVAYNMVMVLVVFLLFRFLKRGVKKGSWLDQIIKYYSYASYDMFFYHLIILEFLEIYKKDLNFFVMYPLVLILTTALIIVKRNVLKIKI